MFKRLRSNILVALLDFVLFLTVWLGRFLSFKGLRISLVFAFLVLAFGRGSYAKSTDKLLISLPIAKISQEVKYFSIVKNPRVEFPDVSAEAVLVADVSANEILYERNSGERFAPASTTKLMTALVALDFYKKGEELIVPKRCTEVGGNRVFLYAGEQVLFEDLLNALLIASANDAACVLASQEDFVKKMNEKAANLGLKNTHFTNAIGFDAPDHAHYSTANDLYKLALEVRKNDWLRTLYGKKEHFFDSGQIARKVTTTNHLLWLIPGSSGIKTGTTAQAGEVLLYEYTDGKKDLIIIVMGSNDRFHETREILEWLTDRYVWVKC